MRWSESPLGSVRSAAFLCAALATVSSANSLRNDFAYDDVHIIGENASIKTLKTLPDALTKPYWPGRFAKELGLWRPTTTALLGIEYAVAGENPLFYHVVNVATHAWVTVLVVLVLAELMTLAAAFVAGLVFAVHPVHVEAVANVIGIAELLPAALCLWACLIHLRSGERTSWRIGLAITGLYALAFGAKESAVTLPAVLFLLDAARRRIGVAELRGYVVRRWRLYLPMAVAAGVLLLARFEVLGSVAHPYGPLGADLLDHVPRIWTLAEVWSHYVRLLVFPADLSSDYSPNVIPIALGWRAENVVGVILTLGILGGALASWRRSDMAPGTSSARALAFGVVWFMITISPVANVVFLSGVLLAERNLYFPSVGFMAAFGWLIVRLARERRRLAVAWVAATLLLMGWKTWTRNATWQNNDTVFGQMIEDYPYSGRSQWLLGDLFFQQGRSRQGLVAYGAAINMVGPHYQLLVEISEKLMDAKYYGAAEHLLEFAWRDHPEIPIAPTLLAVVYSRDSKPEETELWARRTIALDPSNGVAYNLLAGALSEQERWPEAARARLGAIRHGEAHAWQQWFSLAYLRLQARDSAGASQAIDSAMARPTTATARAQLDSLRIQIRSP